MAVLYFLYGFDLNGHAGITDDDVDLNACIGSPVGELFIGVGVVLPCHQLLYYQMLESMAVVGSTTAELAAMEQVVGDADVEIVETRCLYQPSLHDLGIGWDAIAKERVFEDVEIGADGGGVDTTLLGNVVVVDNLSVGKCRHFEETLEGIKVAHEGFLLDFLLQINVDISRQQTDRVLGKIVGGHHTASHRV